MVAALNGGVARGGGAARPLADDRAEGPVTGGAASPVACAADEDAAVGSITEGARPVASAANRDGTAVGPVAKAASADNAACGPGSWAGVATWSMSIAAGGHGTFTR